MKGISEYSLWIFQHKIHFLKGSYSHYTSIFRVLLRRIRSVFGFPYLHQRIEIYFITVKNYLCRKCYVNNSKTYQFSMNSTRVLSLINRSKITGALMQSVDTFKFSALMFVYNYFNIYCHNFCHQDQHLNQFQANKADTHLEYTCIYEIYSLLIIL